MHKIIENLLFGCAAAVLWLSFAATSFPQSVWTPPNALPRHLSSGLSTNAAETTERSLKVDPNVNLTICVTEGTVNVNSWNRSELRVFVHNGSKFAFKVSQKSEKTGDPVWVTIVGTPTGKQLMYSNECVTGGEIEIDLPANATVNVKGRATNTTIDSVRRANVKTAGGDISFRNIAEGLMASTYEGDITVEGSKGAISLESATGNIVVFEAGPSEPGDIFKAKTNSGLISLQKLEHRQVEVNSISGSVAYNGAVLNGGSYSLSTTNGSIRLAIPQSADCTVNATYGFGRFESELPLKIQTENISPGPVKTIVGTLGEGGDTIIRLISNNGSIAIKKQ